MAKKWKQTKHKHEHDQITCLAMLHFCLCLLKLFSRSIQSHWRWCILTLSAQSLVPDTEANSSANIAMDARIWNNRMPKALVHNNYHAIVTKSIIIPAVPETLACHQSITLFSIDLIIARLHLTACIIMIWI